MPGQPRPEAPPLYRLYRLSPDGGILSAEVIEADDDDAARAAALMLAERLCIAGYELWDGGRPVLACLAPA